MTKDNSSKRVNQIILIKEKSKNLKQLFVQKFKEGQDVLIGIYQFHSDILLMFVVPLLSLSLHAFLIQVEC